MIVIRPKSPLCERTHLLRRQQLDVRSFEVIDDVGRDPDISYDHVAGMRLTRREHERQFWTGKCHRHRGVDTVSDELRCIGGQPAWQVDRHDRDAGCIHVRDHRLHHSAESGLEARSENGVDDQRTLRDFREVQLPRLFVRDLDHRNPEVAEDVQIESCVAPNVCYRPDHENGRIDASLQQRPGDNEAIAAVVAAATQHGNAPFEERFVGCLNR